MDKPIIFNTKMVRAILEGKKTTTRRIIKQKYENADIDWFENKYGKRLVYIQNDVPPPVRNPNGTTTHTVVAMEEINKPYEKGDILYVRETWWIGDLFNENGDVTKMNQILYRADKPRNDIAYEYVRWKPSIHMPKSKARLFLEVVDVRAEKLSSMEKEDFIKEGIEERNCAKKFAKLWDSTVNKNDIDKYGWFADPWVWVIDFRVIERK